MLTADIGKYCELTLRECGKFGRIYSRIRSKKVQDVNFT